MRTRSRYEPYPPNATAAFAGTGTRFGDTMSDEVGLHVWKPCNHTSVRLLGSDGAITWTRTDRYGATVSGTFSPTGPYGAGFECARSSDAERASPSGAVTEDVVSAAQRELYETLEEAGRSSLHVISFARELASTISMLRNPFKVVSWVAKHTSGMKKPPKSLKWRFKAAHERASGNGLLKSSSDAWLEGTYGWNPFVSDLITCLNMARGLQKTRQQLAAEGPKKVTIRKSSYTVAEQGPKNDNQKIVLLASAKQARQLKYSLHTTVKPNPSVETEGAVLSVLRTLNIDRLGYAVWDAVPYSFVVDWFLPMGKYLDSALSGPSFYLMTGPLWSVFRDKTTVSASWVGNSTQDFMPYDSYYDLRYGGSASYAESVKIFARSRIDYSDVMLQNPATGMHGTRIASGAALGWGALARWHR